MFSNKTDYKQDFKTDDTIEDFKAFIKSQGGSTNSTMKVGEATHKGSKISLSFFSGEMRKRIIKSVS